MNEGEHNGGMRLTEMALIVLVLVILVAVFLPVMLHSQNRAQRRDDIAATLRRIESAKAQYAMDQKKKTGDRVDMKDLVKGGYLAAEPELEVGTYVVGPVGTPASYDTDSEREDGGDHH